METGQEVVSLRVGAVNDLVDSLILGCKEFLVTDPSQGVQSESLLIRLFPLFTNDVVPLFQSVSVHLEVTVLRPSGEALNLLETLCEVRLDLHLEL